MKTKFIENESNIPFVKLFLDNGNELIAIIDTGSDSTTADLSILKNNKDCVFVDSNISNVDFTGMFSTESANSISARASFLLDRNESPIDIEFTLLDLSKLRSVISDTYKIVPDIILGSDFLQSNNAKVDYKNSVLVL